MSVKAQEGKRRHRLWLYRGQQGKCFFCAEPMLPPYLNPDGGRGTPDTCVLFRLTDPFERVRGRANNYVGACVRCADAVSHAAERRLPREELHRRSGRRGLRGPGHDLMENGT